MKSGFVISKDIRTPRDVMGWMMGVQNCIIVDELSATIIFAASNGWETDTIEDNQLMVTKGQEILEQMKSRNSKNRGD